MELEVSYIMTKNNLGMREITTDEATELGIDLSMAKSCRTLRKLAKLDRLKLDETEHRSGLNNIYFIILNIVGKLCLSM